MFRHFIILNYFFLVFFFLIDASYSVSGSSEWLPNLIQETKKYYETSSAKLSPKERETLLQKIKRSFAVSHMSEKAYGTKLASLPPSEKQSYLELMDRFFEKVVIHGVFGKPSDSKTSQKKVTYKIFPPKQRKDSLCATAIVGPIVFEQRVDWQVGEGEKDRYETRFCIRAHKTFQYEIVDVVVEGISWVEDFSEEVQMLYRENEKQGNPKQIHQKLIDKLRTQIQGVSG